MKMAKRQGFRLWVAGFNSPSLRSASRQSSNPGQTTNPKHKHPLSWIATSALPPRNDIQKTTAPALPSLRSANRRSGNPGQTTTPTRSSFLPGLPRRFTPRNDERGGLPRRFTPRNDLKRGTALLIITSLILGLALPILGFITPQAAQASNDWWNEDYRYRAPVDITSVTPQTNVYLELTLDTAGTTTFNNDCSDLRFVSLSGQLIPYHLASGCGTGTTQIQILFTNLPAGASTIYMYYGNPQAPQASATQPFNNLADTTTGNIGSQEQSTGPIAYWKLDEGHGTTAHDSTTTANHGTFHNTPTWQTEDMCVAGKCLYFDGTDDAIGADSTHISAQTGTISIWAKPTRATGGSDEYMVMANRNDHRIYLLRLGSSGNLGIRLGTAAAVNTNFHLTRSTWYHLALTWDNGTYHAYANGQQVATGSYSGLSTIDTCSSLGSFNDCTGTNFNSFYQGFLDQAKLYNHPRTQQQIQQDYIQGIQSMQAQQGNLSNGLVGHWKMDEPSWDGTIGEVKDSSGNNNNGQAVDGASIDVGKYGSAGSFNSMIDQHVRINSSVSLAENQERAYSAWIYPDGTSAWGTIFSPNNGGNEGRFGAREAGTRQWGHLCSSDPALSPSVLPIINQWNHIVFTYNFKERVLKGYLNGQLTSTIALPDGSTCPATSPTHMKIGSKKADTSAFNGEIDELRYYTRHLSQPEISQLYTSAPKPVAYYDFEEGSGGTAYDKSGNNHSGSWNGTGHQYAEGKKGKSAKLNGQDNYIEAASSHMLESSLVTVSTWVKLDQGSPDDQVLIGKYDAGANKDYNLRIIGGQLGFSIFSGIASYQVSAGMTLSADQWHYVVGSWDGTVLSIYVNGVLRGSSTPGITKNNTPVPLVLGSRIHYDAVNSYYLHGQLDEVKIYNYARTPGQILADMQSSMPNELNPVGHWKLDENQGSITRDSGATQLSGSMTDTVWVNGVSGSAVHFNGNGANVSIGDVPAYKVIQKSVSFWAKPDASVGGTSTLFTMGNHSNWYAGLSNSNRMMVSYSNDSSQVASYSANEALILNEWHYYTYTFEQTSQAIFISFYRDGQLITRNTHPSALSSTYGNNTTIGLLYPGYAASNPYIGALDEVKIYNQALTPQQIAIDYNQSSAMIAGATSTEPTTSGSGAAATQPSQSQDSKYCIPGSTDYCAKPVGEWLFEEKSGNPRDTSGNNFTASQVGSVPRIPGKNGTAVSIHPPTYRFTVNSAPAPTADFTLEAWINRDPGGNGDIIGWEQITYQMRIHDGKLAFRMKNNAGAMMPYVLSSSDVPESKWTHVVATYSNGSEVKLYVNGQHEATDSSYNYTPWPGPAQMLIGYASSAYFNGGLDDIRVYNYPRTPAQVAWDYNKGKPIAHYRMDECSGTTIHDASDNHLHGTLNLGASGITTPGTCNSTNTAWSLGKMGKRNASMSFDGVDDFVDIGDVFYGDQLSVCAWFNNSVLLNGAASKNIVIKQNGYGGAGSSGSSGREWGLSVEGNVLRWLSWTMTPSQGTAVSVSGATTILTNQWYYACAVQNGAGLPATIYLNGLKDGSAIQAGPTLNNVASIQIGTRTNNNNGRYWNGQIDDVQIFNYALTQKQIDVLYNGGAVRWGN